MQDNGKTPGGFRRSGCSLKPGQAKQIEAKTLMELFPRLGAGLVMYIMQRAWNNASGCEDCTKDFYCRNRVVYVTLTSSLRASMVRFQTQAIVESMNRELAQNELLKPYTDAGELVKGIVVK